MKRSLLAMMIAAVFSLNAVANETFSIMNDRLGSAIQDNANNHNPGTQQRVNDAYNGAKQAISGPMDNSNAGAITAPSSVTEPAATLSVNKETSLPPAITREEISHYGVKTNPAGVPTGLTGVQAPAMKKGMVQGIDPATPERYASMKPAQSMPVLQNNISQAVAAIAAKPAQVDTINVSATALKPETRVNAIIKGQTIRTTAGELAKVDPEAQVSVPHTPALLRSAHPRSDREKVSGPAEQGTGNGANNAANSHSAHGMGGDNHIGGGAAQSGSRNLGHW